MPRLAIPAALVTIAAVLTLLALLPTRDVLAKAAERMRGVRTLHYTVTITAMPDQGVREIWSHGNKTYCRVRVNNRIVGEAWINSERTVAYDKEENRVAIKSNNQGLQRALSILQCVQYLKPADWRPLLQQGTSEGGESWLAFEMPGTGQFNGMGISGDTKMRLWIDEKTALPGKLDGLLRSSPSGEWKPFMVFTFLWDESEVQDSLFEPSYPADAKVTLEQQSSRNPPTEEGPGPSSETTATLPTEKVPNAAPADFGTPILAVSRDGKTGITLEKAWIHPAGLVILRCTLQGRVPFGQPPQFADPSKKAWGLKPEEIPQVIKGMLLLEPPAQTVILTSGGMANRWGMYMVFQYSALPDCKAPVKLTYRQLLARTARPEETSLGKYAEAVLNDPSAWELYEFSISTEPYVTEQIPEEIYASPNLRVTGPFLTALRGILRDYEAQSPEKALQFLKSQGPHTQELLRAEMQRLTAK